MDAICGICNENRAEGYGHFYKGALGYLDNFHNDVTWCHACGEEARERTAAVFAGIRGAIPSFCPVEGCGKPMLYEEETEFPPLVTKLSTILPKKENDEIVLHKTEYVAVGGIQLFLAHCSIGGMKYRKLVINDTGRKIDSGALITCAKKK